MTLIPSAPVKKEIQGPRRLLIYSPPKIGKTSNLVHLPESYLVDLEGGAHGFYEGMIIKANSPRLLKDFFAEASESNFHARFLIIDTVTKLEEFAMPWAGQMYKQTPIGKNWKGKDITTLPNGAGYLYLRKAVMELIDRFQSMCDYLILLGHVKYTNLSTQSEEVLIKELSLTGKLKEIVMANADAIAFMYVGENPNERYLSFESNGNTISGSRVEHLDGKRILISTKKEDGIEANWNLIYPELN